MAASQTSLAVLDGNNASKTITTHTNPAGDQRYAISLDEAGAAVYRFSASFTPTATGAVTVISIKGSATKTVRVRRIMLGGAATALSATLFGLQRTSALGAGGTAVNPTAAKLDSGTVAAATAVVAHYTTTLKAAGTASDGPLTTLRLFQDTVTTPTVASRLATFLFPEYGVSVGQAIVLRGTSDFIEVQNLNAGNLASGTVLDYMIELVEDGA
jgi:hypothetical protein